METARPAARAVRLRCEYLENPLGIDATRPRLSWWMHDDRRGARQTAWQVRVASDAGELRGGKADLWDSGKVESARCTHIEYAGAPLGSRQQAAWSVRLWDADGNPGDWSDIATFELGLVQRSDWSALWIGSRHSGGPYTSPPAPYLRKRFATRAAVQHARLHVAALGLYEIEINGQRVGDAILAPGRTDYSKRVHAQTYDVTALLRGGDNVLGALLGDGWYAGHNHSDPRQFYGDRPRLLAQLEIACADGSRATIATDDTWRSIDSPIRSSDLLMGEDSDARRERAGWSTADTDDADWEAVQVFDDPGVKVVPSPNPPIRAIQEVRPVAPAKVSANKRRWLFDLGQNMVGVVKLKVRNAPPGRTIDLRHTEMLDKDGKPYTLALRTARATDHYTTRGGDEETFVPRFTFHGFRFVEVRDCPGQPQPDTVTGIVLHTDLPVTGSFECSDPLVNQLQSNILWSQKGNFLDIPTDCPQRDERLGWTGDAQVFVRTAAFNMDVAPFFTKWMKDVQDAQFEDGHVPSVVPHVPSIHHEGGPAWADACIICPWTIHLCYGDTRILADCYPMMQRFIAWLQANCRDHIRADEHWKWKGYGDWLNMNAETPKDLIGTAFYAHCADLMSRIATVLGRTDDAATYRSLFETVRSAWQRRYLTPGGLVASQTQTADVLALHFDLLPGDVRPIVLEALVADIRSRGNHLSTGFVGTPYLLHVLSDNGQLDLAYELLLQKTFPSWLFPVTHGATTMWERWDGWTPEKGFHDAGMNSYNHYAYGAVGAWMYAVVAGIELDPSRPGYQHVRIQPRPGGTLTHAGATLDSAHGRIESRWSLQAGTLTLHATIPANVTATIRVPTSDPSSVRESGKPIDAVASLRVVSRDADALVLHAGAGRYAFTAAFASQ
jgi:alpha-L-rhamnosidase